MLDPGVSPTNAPAPEVDEPAPLRCVPCGAPITTAAERIAVDGAHESTRLNLAGVLFRVGTFARAPGCLAVGEPSAQWTWFPGYTWQIVVCRGCGEHLGWRYRGESSFYGLLLDRLREGDAR